VGDLRALGLARRAARVEDDRGVSGSRATIAAIGVATAPGVDALERGVAAVHDGEHRDAGQLGALGPSPSSGAAQTSAFAPESSRTYWISSALSSGVHRHRDGRPSARAPK
jgi:hypothetical protein